MSNFEFDAVYSAVTGLYMHDPFAPDVVNVEGGDVEVQGKGWHVITGKTGQYSYNGAVMHPSESADDNTVREWVREVDGDLFAIVEVREESGEFPEGDPIGWAIVYRKAE